MTGLFLENGPLRVTKTKEGEFIVDYLDNSWVEVSHMVFVDQPIDAGFSFGSTNITTEEQVGRYMLWFLQGFYEKFPKMQTHDFMITGESYSGKYIPNIAKTILDFNKGA